MRYKNSEKSLEEIGQELRVEYVLEGSVRREGNRTRISVQLIQVNDQAQLWAQTYDQELTGILDLQIEVAERVVRSLTTEFLPGRISPAAMQTPTTNSVAYDTYLKGRYQLNKSTAAGARKAVHLFEQATREDATFALAYVGLADAHNYLARVGTQPPKEIAPLVREALMEALGTAADSPKPIPHWRC